MPDLGTINGSVIFVEPITLSYWRLKTDAIGINYEVLAFFETNTIAAIMYC